MIIASCTLPGKGIKAQKSYEALSPVIKALEAYVNDNGVYPEHLKRLTPKHLKSVPEKLNRFPVKYNTTNNQKGFELGFQYKGPGINWCNYKDTTKSWKCGGAF